MSRDHDRWQSTLRALARAATRRTQPGGHPSPPTADPDTPTTQPPRRQDPPLIR